MLMVRVFYTDISDLPSSVEGLMLSDYRLNKLEKISLPGKRKQSIGAELLLNYALCKLHPELEPPFEIDINEYGKPKFTNLSLEFNLSHSANFAVCAVSDKEIGVDAQENTSYNQRIAERYYTENEKLSIERAEDKDYEFSRIWSAKESAVKYLGLGLSKSLDLVYLKNKNTILVEPEKNELNFFHTFIKNLHISVCGNWEEDICIEYVDLK